MDMMTGMISRGLTRDVMSCIIYYNHGYMVFCVISRA